MDETLFYFAQDTYYTNGSNDPFVRFLYLTPKDPDISQKNTSNLAKALYNVSERKYGGGNFLLNLDPDGESLDILVSKGPRGSYVEILKELVGLLERLWVEKWDISDQTVCLNHITPVLIRIDEVYEKDTDVIAWRFQAIWFDGTEESRYTTYIPTTSKKSTKERNPGLKLDECVEKTSEILGLKPVQVGRILFKTYIQVCYVVKVFDIEYYDGRSKGPAATRSAKPTDVEEAEELIFLTPGKEIHDFLFEKLKIDESTFDDEEKDAAYTSGDEDEEPELYDENTTYSTYLENLSKYLWDKIKDLSNLNESKKNSLEFTIGVTGVKISKTKILG